MKLTMRHFLEVVEEHVTSTREALLDEGFPPKVIYRKAEAASLRGYTDYGVVADRPWLTERGAQMLAAWRDQGSKP